MKFSKIRPFIPTIFHPILQERTENVDTRKREMEESTTGYTELKQT